MLTKDEYDQIQVQIAALLQNTISTMRPDLLAKPELAELLNKMVDDQINNYILAEEAKPQPGDGGLADLIGLGKDSNKNLGQAAVSSGVRDYDESVEVDRILATADLYYLYMHERLGVFRVVSKLQELFRDGTLRISSGDGAYGLYRYDKHGILRYKIGERTQAYNRVFGYTKARPGFNARPNQQFHGLFTHFIAEVAKFWRDKRISDVIRNNANDPSFGSIAIVRRAGLDLRNNLKNSSYGYINVLRVETSQALAESFKVLNSPDIKAQMGADSAWDVIELVLWQYFQQAINASAINRMAVSGREIIRWVAQPFVLNNERTDFETALRRIAEFSEEWISSEEGMRLSRPTPPPRQVFQPGAPPSGGRPERTYSPNGTAAAMIG